MPARSRFAGFCTIIFLALILVSTTFASDVPGMPAMARWQSTPIPDAVYEPITAENIADVQTLSHIQASNGLTDVSWSPSGTTLAAAATNGAVWVYRLLELDESPAIWANHSQGAFGARIGPDNRVMATVGADGFLFVSNLATNTLLHTINYGTWLWTIDFHPDGDMLATGSIDGRIVLWDLDSGDPISGFDATHDDAVTKIDFNTDGTQLVSASLDGTARVWDVATGDELLVLEGHEEGLSTATYSPDSTLIATASGDMTVRVWDAETGDPLHELTGHISGISGISFNADSTLLASGGQDVGIRIWDMETGDQIAVLAGHGAWIRSVAFNSDGTMLASCDFAGNLRIWGIPS